MILEYMYKHLQLHEKCGKLGFFTINSRKQRKRRKRDVIISNELVFRCDKNSKQKRVEYPQKQT
jgi:hypothetical protein